MFESELMGKLMVKTMDGLKQNIKNLKRGITSKVKKDAWPTIDELMWLYACTEYPNRDRLYNRLGDTWVRKKIFAAIMGQYSKPYYII